MRVIRNRAVCLVDDDPKEVERARKYLGEMNFCVGGGESVEIALSDLQRQGRKPDIFLIDMYGAEEQADSEADQTLATARARYLREEAKFYSTLDKYGQRTKRGFKNVNFLRNKHKFRRIPIAFFTRKGTLNNVLDAYEDFPNCPILKKPDPAPSQILSASQDLKSEDLAQLYDQAFDEGKRRIAEDIRLVIERFSWRSKYGDLIVGVFLGVIASIVANLVIGAAREAFGPVANAIRCLLK